MAAKRNIEIVKGDDYSHVITLSTRVNGTITPTNITGRTYTASLYKNSGQATADADFNCVITDAAGGEVTIYLAHGVTSELAVCCYKWSFKQNIGGVVTTILIGKADVVK